jgi:hypothetical protein
MVSFPLNFARFTDWRLFATPGIVKLCESPGKAGGLPFYLVMTVACGLHNLRVQVRKRRLKI